MEDLSRWAPTIVSVLTMIFVAGKTYGRINGQEITLKRHEDALDDHGVRIDTLENQAARSKGWREGFEASEAKTKARSARTE